MEGISDLFASFSQPDPFEMQVQMELLSWREGGGRSKRRRDGDRQSFRSWWRRSSAKYRTRRKAEGVNIETTAARRAQKREWVRRKRAEQRAA